MPETTDLLIAMLVNTALEYGGHKIQCKRHNAVSPESVDCDCGWKGVKLALSPTVTVGAEQTDAFFNVMTSREHALKPVKSRGPCSCPCHWDDAERMADHCAACEPTDTQQSET